MSVGERERELILKRIAEIEEYENEFDPRTMKWANVRIGPIPIQEIEFTLLPDDELVETFEIILRQHYKQM